MQKFTGNSSSHLFLGWKCRHNRCKLEVWLFTCCLIVLDRLHFKKLSKDVKTKSKLQIILGPEIP